MRKSLADFKTIGVSKDLLEEAFGSNLSSVNLDMLFRHCEAFIKCDIFFNHSITNSKIKTPQQLQMLAKPLKFMKQLIQEQGIESVSDDIGVNPLEYTACLGDTDALSCVLEQCPGFECNSKDSDGNNLLLFLALSGSVDAIIYILEHYPGLEYSKNNAGYNLLHFAALSGSVDAIIYILDHYPGLEYSKNNAGYNLLHFAALSGSVAAITYILDRYPNLEYSKNNTGSNLLHFAALSGSVDAITYILDRYPNLKYSKNYNDQNLLHYAARSGSVDAIICVLDSYPGSEDSKSNNDDNFLHFAAWEGNIAAIDYILELYPELKDSKNREGSNILHFVGWSGNVDAIAHVLDLWSDDPTTSESNKGNNLLHYTAWSGNTDAISYVLNRYPKLKYSKNKFGANLLHSVAFSGSVDAITYVLGLCPELKASIDNAGRNLLDYVTLSGNVDALTYVLSHCQELQDCKHNLLHIAAWSGNVEMITYVLKAHPELEYSKDDAGRNILHFAAMSGNCNAVDYVLENYPYFKETRDNEGCNFLHLALRWAKLEVIIYALKHYPALSARLWSPDNFGVTLDGWALTSGIRPLPSELLMAHLSLATKALYEDVATENQVVLINSFYEQWLDLLLSETFILNSLELNKLLKENRLSDQAREFLTKLSPIFALKAIECDNKALSLDLLQRLLSATLNILKPRQGGFFNNAPKSEFVEALVTFKSQAMQKEVGNASLSEEAILTLLVIINDYRRKSIDQTTEYVDALLSAKLLATQSIAIRRPQAIIMKGLEDMNPDSYLDHFLQIETTFEQLNLSSDTARISRETILPGIRHLLTSENEIVKHMMEHYGVLYYLDDQQELPMHTDHVVYQDEQSYRDMLHRLIENLFGSFYQCKKLGKPDIFFDNLSTGVCLEGRIRDLFDLVTTFSEVKGIDEFMKERMQEYRAYMSYFLNTNEDGLYELDTVCDFILQRYDEFPCIAHEDYAPDAKIAEAGVRLYLKNILNYEEAAEKKTPSC